MRWIGRRKKPEPPRPESAADAGPATTGDLAPEGVLAELRSHLIQAADGRLDDVPIDPEAPLFDYGYVDSLTAVSLLEMIRDRFGVEISEVDLVGRLRTLAAITTHIVSARTS